MATSSPPHFNVFVSYSHKDKKSLERLKVHLNPLLEGEGIDAWLWDDTQILAGQRWKEEIEKALQQADAAVLLVTADFVYSPAIRNNELPPLLKAAELRGIPIIPIILNHCNFARHKQLAQFQAAHDASIPLSNIPANKKEKWWADVAVNVYDTIVSQKAKQYVTLSPPFTMYEQAVDPPSSTPRSPAEASPTSASPSENVLALYRKKVEFDPDIAHIHLPGIAQTLLISDFYVSVRLYKASSLYDAVGDPYWQTHDILQLASQQNLWLRDHVSMRIDPVLALKRFHHFVVLGNAGSGKTTLLKYLTMQVLHHKAVELADLPIYLSLHEFARSASDDLLGFIAVYWKQAYNLPETQCKQMLEKCISSSNVTLFLDGLDEAAIGKTSEQAENSYQRVYDALMRFAKNYPLVPMLVTTRKTDYHLRRPLTHFTELELLDLRPQEVTKFVRRWFDHAGGENKFHLAAKLIADLEARPHLASLAANPLRLSLIALAYHNGMQLSSIMNGTQLYQSCIPLLLTNQATPHSIEHQLTYTAEVQNRLFQEIARNFHNQRLRHFHEEEVLRIIDVFLLAQGKARERCHDVLQMLSGTCVLQKTANGGYRFLHLTLQEYFTACSFGHSSLLLSHLGDPWWENVFLFSVGRTQNIDEFLRVYLLEEYGDIFRSNLLLAGRSLAVHSAVTNPLLWEKIPHFLFEQLRDANCALTRQQSAETLTEIGRAYPYKEVTARLLAILTDKDVRETTRMCVATALGNYGTHTLAVSLLDFLVKEGPYLGLELCDQIGKAVGKLADASLFPKLQKFIAAPETDPRVAIALVHIIDQIGDIRIATILFPLLREDHIDASVRAALAFSVGLHGDTAIHASLLTLIGSPTTIRFIAENAIVALAFHGSHSILSNMAALLLQQDISLQVRLKIAQALSIAGNDTTLDYLETVFADPKQEMSIRSLCTAIFVRRGMRTRRSQILQRLDAGKVETALLVPFVLALAKEEEKQESNDVLALLRSLRFRMPDGEERNALTITLGVLGDYSVQQQLKTLFLQGAIPPSLYQPVAACIVQSEALIEIEQMLTDMSRKQEKVAIQSLIEAMSEIDNSIFIPLLFKIMANHTINEYIRICAVKSIQQIKLGREIIEQLIQILQYYELHDSFCGPSLLDTIFQAMWRMSHRIGVSVIQEGMEYRIIEHDKREFNEISQNHHAE